MQITPRYSFESKDGKYEADFGALVTTGWREGIVQLLGECKSFGKKGKAQFKCSELSKLVKLAEKSNNSVIVFATLNKELSNTDRNILRKLVVRLRELKFNGKKSIDVLILTGNELFAQRGIKEGWQKLGEEYKPFIDRADNFGIRDLCDVTQQIYLGIESYWDYFKNKQEIKSSTPNA